MRPTDLTLNSRRESLGGLGLLGGAALSAVASAAQRPAGHWDRDVDVICVGGGAAGCTAAVTAAHHGAKVLLVEKGPTVGGTTMKSGGIAWIPNNFLLREAGEKDEKRDCLQYLCRFAYPHLYTSNSPTLGVDEPAFPTIEAFYDNGAAMIDFVRSIGAAQFGVFSVGAGGARPPDYADHLPENKCTKGRSLAPLDADGKPVAGRIGDGSSLIKGTTLADLAAKVSTRLAGLADKTGGVALGAGFAEALHATIERFNGFARSGVDLDFGRGQQAYDREWQGFFSALRPGTLFGPNTMPSLTMHPLRDEGPYYAIILGAGALDTNGGPVINANAQVIGGDGAPIVGLYGAGNCIASPSREAYYGAGGTIGMAMTFGYIAARSATHKAV